ncbi:hypothetical protein [Morganella psychrotolerans]|uniref:hypothetical protein n=1 Tax=Morganella psychrotolerans TaxID=368603 RepID=UPI0039AEA63A
MKRKIIKRVLIAIPILFLIKCSGVVDDILGSQFPLNINNDGNNIKIHINEIKNSIVEVEAIYLTERCTKARLNAAYTEISYSPIRRRVEIDNAENSNGITTFTVPISGGGWCNWGLTRIVITPTPRKNKASASTSIAIDISKTDINSVSYNISLAPIIRKKENKKYEFYYIISKAGMKEISNFKNGNIYVNAYLKDELLTESLVDEGIVIFPNGTKVDYSGNSQLIFPEFNTILKNSKLKGELNEE